MSRILDYFADSFRVTPDPQEQKIVVLGYALINSVIRLTTLSTILYVSIRVVETALAHGPLF